MGETTHIALMKALERYREIFGDKAPIESDKLEAILLELKENQ